MTGCYEDKGNYVYDDVLEDITVQLDETFNVRQSKEAFTYTITPEIITPDGDKSYLEYAWTLSKTGPMSLPQDTISREETVTLEIDPTAEDFSYNYYLRLYVKDNLRHTTVMRPTQLVVFKPYTDSWIVLHEVDGHAELGSVEYANGEIFVTPNAYTQERGESFQGQPVKLFCWQYETSKYTWLYEAPSKLYALTTDLEESGLLNQVDGFSLMANWTKLFSEYQFDLVDFDNLEGSGSSYGFVACTNGHVFRAPLNSPVMFEMNPSSTLTGEYYFEKAVCGPQAGIAFDNIGHRFVHCDLQSSGDSWSGYEPSGLMNGGDIRPIAYRDGLDVVDPNAIDPDEQILKFVNGYHYEASGVAPWQKYSAYAWTVSPDGMSHMYVFRYYPLTHTDVATVSGHYDFITPEGVTEDTPMTSGSTYSNIIFYAVGNKVYRLDFTSGTSSVIYQHEDAGAEISALLMAHNGTYPNEVDTEGSDTYGHPYSRTLGVAVNTSDGEGQLVVLQLNTAGNVDSDHLYPSTQVHTGFGPIVDIEFI